MKFQQQLLLVSTVRTLGSIFPPFTAVSSWVRYTRGLQYVLPPQSSTVSVRISTSTFPRCTAVLSWVRYTRVTLYLFYFHSNLQYQWSFRHQLPRDVLLRRPVTSVLLELHCIYFTSTVIYSISEDFSINFPAMYCCGVRYTRVVLYLFYLHSHLQYQWRFQHQLPCDVLPRRPVSIILRFYCICLTILPLQ